MKIEHIAYNVADPVAVAAWYVAHLGLTVVRHLPQPAQTHFLADQASSVIEIYCNPPDQVPNYAAMDPLLLHIAFATDDAAADAARLLIAGATASSNTTFPDGTHLIMLRDPWGFALQLCQRGTPLLPA